MDEGSTSAMAAAERHIIERPRLTKILDESNARLILLVAPAGYGKTTLARQWLRDKPHVWYQATPASADPAEFAVRLDRLLWAGKARLTQLLRTTPDLAFDAGSLTEILAQQIPAGESRWLVLDDYQELIGSPAESLLREVAQRLSIPTMIASRTRPTWVTARMLVYQQALELRTQELQFTPQEVEALLPGRSGTPTAFEQTRGWPALVSLTAGLRQPQTPMNLAPSLVYEFFAEELVHGIRPELEDALSRVAIAPSQLQSLVANEPQLAATALQRGFLQQHDATWAMHPLVRDFLTRRLLASSDGHSTISEVAAELLHGRQWDEALGAIELIHDQALTDRLLIEAVPSLLESGRLATARRMCRFARKIGSRSAVLDLVDADEYERRGAHADAFRFAIRAASDATAPPSLRTDALLLAAHATYMSDRTEEASRLYAQASEVAQSTGQQREALWGAFVTQLELRGSTAATALTRLCDLAESGDPTCVLRAACAELQFGVHQGLREDVLMAGERAMSALAHVDDVRLKSSFLSMYGLALCLAGNFSRSEQLGEAALREAKSGNLKFAIPHIELRLALTKTALGAYAAAAQAIATARSPQRHPSTYLKAVADAARTRLLIVQGLGSEVLRGSPASTTGLPALYQAEGLAARSLAAACGGAYSEALDLAAAAESISADCQTTAHTETARTIALANGDPDSMDIDRLLGHVESTGMILPPVLAARGLGGLKTALARAVGGEKSVTATHILELASVGRRSAHAAGRSDQGLSRREREVLDLLLQGLSNREIARALFISDVTVKVHLRHVYAKLGVKRRTEAVIVARDLGMARSAENLSGSLSDSGQDR